MRINRLAYSSTLDKKKHNCLIFFTILSPMIYINIKLNIPFYLHIYYLVKSQHIQVYMCCIFGVLIVRKVTKCNVPGCSHATAVFHFRLNIHLSSAVGRGSGKKQW